LLFQNSNSCRYAPEVKRVDTSGTTAVVLLLKKGLNGGGGLFQGLHPVDP
jgi:hypothetical protein